MTPLDLNNHLALIEQKCGFGVARELEAHIEALGRDADRYRWLRQSLFQRNSVTGEIIANVHGPFDDGVDSAIDAARSAP
jgi:hypothetical protein